MEYAGHFPTDRNARYRVSCSILTGSSTSSLETTRTTSGPACSCWSQKNGERQKLKWTYPICRFVEGACVMTELDCGDGMACWITTLVSWFGIRVLVSWWDPGPAIAPPTVLCMEIFCERKEKKGWWRELNIYIWDIYISIPNLLFEIYRTTIRNMKAPTIWKVTDSCQILNQLIFL